MHGELQRATRSDPRQCEVAGKFLRAESPLVLPSHRCVKCGSTERGGVIHNDVVNYVNPLVWLTFLISGLITIIAYLVTRKQMKVQYYLCPKCADSRKIGHVTTSLISIVALTGLAVALVTGGFDLAAMFGGALLISFVMRIIFVKPPLRAVVHDQGTFSLKGASREFLTSLERKQLEAVNGPDRFSRRAAE